ncbi:MAG: type 1 glutamine amidotransferase [Acidimicrobiia bacterium]
MIPTGATATAGHDRAERRRALVVHHLEPEGPALLADALARAGCAIDTVRTDLGHALPADLAGHDGLVVMGGPMSAASDHGFPTRGAEIALIGDAVDRGTPVLGICLGAQLLAVAGGAPVGPGPRPEIGWGAVRIGAGAAGDPLFGDITDEVTVLHWHRDTFDLPAGAVHLASSAEYPNQAFRLGPSAWGLQFHVEVDIDAVQRFAAAFGPEVADAPAIVREAAEQLARSEPERLALLDRFAGIVAEGRHR